MTLDLCCRVPLWARELMKRQRFQHRSSLAHLGALVASLFLEQEKFPCSFRCVRGAEDPLEFSLACIGRLSVFVETAVERDQISRL